MLLVCAAMLPGCMLMPKKPDLRIDLQGPADLNEGIPCNLLVRALSSTAFHGESYAEVARLVAQTDTSVLYSGVIYTPSGRSFEHSLTIVPPKGSAIGVYVFFTTLTGSWRLLIEPPLPRRIAVRLNRSSILTRDSK